MTIDSRIAAGVTGTDATAEETGGTPCLMTRRSFLLLGGIGPQRDVVAFNYTCTHQGGSLFGTYKPEDKALGPCPLHLTTFDLVRHGIFISGQAYQSLPQVLLELEGDDIYATGMFGLIYGRFDNLQG